MAKKNKDKTGRIVLVSREDNILLKKYFLDAESMGVTITNAEICERIFSKGLHATIRDFNDSKGIIQ